MSTLQVKINSEIELTDWKKFHTRSGKYTSTIRNYNMTKL